MLLTIYTDGGSRGNPGPASIGIVGFSGNKKLFTHSEAIGTTTNNVAEYNAVIKALTLITTHLKKQAFTQIRFKSDSKLLVEQLSGRFKVKTPHIIELFKRVKVLEMKIGIPIAYEWVARNNNVLADALVNSVYDDDKS